MVWSLFGSRSAPKSRAGSTLASAAGSKGLRINQAEVDQAQKSINEPFQGDNLSQRMTAQG